MPERDATLDIHTPKHKQSTHQPIPEADKPEYTHTLGFGYMTEVWLETDMYLFVFVEKLPKPLRDA